MVADCRDLLAKHGFRTIKLKGGVFAPEHDVATIAALREALGEEYLLRLDPNAVWTAETAIRMGKRLEAFDLEYYEDPTWGIAGMAAVRERVRIPIATNMCLIDFDHFAPAIRENAVDIVLSDPWYWGGLYNTKILAAMCKTFGLGVGLHSGTEFGIGLAAMLHVAAAIPNLVHAIDSHYHHLTDDVIAGGMLRYIDGAMSPPEGPAWASASTRTSWRYTPKPLRVSRPKRVWSTPPIRGSRIGTPSIRGGRAKKEVAQPWILMSGKCGNVSSRRLRLRSTTPWTPWGTRGSASVWTSSRLRPRATWPVRPFTIRGSREPRYDSDLKRPQFEYFGVFRAMSEGCIVVASTRRPNAIAGIGAR